MDEFDDLASLGSRGILSIESIQGLRSSKGSHVASSILEFRVRDNRQSYFTKTWLSVGYHCLVVVDVSQCLLLSETRGIVCESREMMIMCQLEDVDF